MINLIKKYWEEKPLLLILIAGGFFRLISVIFSKGWGMQDDHFLVIETAQSWVDKCENNNWVPGNGITEPPGHSYLYPGLHYLLFLFLKLIHITGPQTKMYIVRFLHALYSISVITLGYKITEKLSDKKNAALVGLLLAIYWFMPFLSVRNLAEVVCIPVLMYGVYLITNYQLPITNYRLSNLLLAGLMLGLAFSIRYQTFIFIAGIFIVILIQNSKFKIQNFLFLLIGFLLPLIIIEGGIDFFIWGYPFAEIKEYIRYNSSHAYNYITQPWYIYVLFLSGLLIPPISIFLFIGFFYNLRCTMYDVQFKNLKSKIVNLKSERLLIFLPTFLFLVFHSYFPNKQERFILPIIPFIIILGVIGWNDLLKSKLKTQKSKVIKYSWVFFWIINLALLPIISTVYSKRARVESMVYLSKYQNINYFIQEGTSNLAPLYYLGQWANYTNISDDDLLNSKFKIQNSKFIKFVLFYDDKNLSKRVNTIRNILPGLKYETTIEPGFIDKVIYKLNPINTNQTIYIYKNEIGDWSSK